MVPAMTPVGTWGWGDDREGQLDQIREQGGNQGTLHREGDS